jgi:hypothetical protein
MTIDQLADDLAAVIAAAAPAGPLGTTRRALWRSWRWPSGTRAPATLVRGDGDIPDSAR